MDRTSLSFLALISTMIACNMPGSVTGATPTFVATVVVPPSPTLVPTLPPSDVAFTIDCSALDASRATDCESYISATRDEAYPVLREATGVLLSDCYDEIHYTIIVGDAAPGAGGIADGSNITFSQTYSVDLPHRYDVHEMLHSTSQCSGALDQHVFHGMVMNYVYSRLGVLEAGYFIKRADAVDLNDFLLEAVKTSSGSVLADQCRGILGNQMTMAYFDLGEDAVHPLYRSTIDSEPASAPSSTLVDVWGIENASKVQVLLETLEQQFNYPFDVPACGY